MRALVLLLLLLAGCDAPSPPIASIAPDRETPNPLSGPSGTLVGQVRWVGPLPAAKPIQAIRPVAGGRTESISRPAPNLPIIDAGTGGVAGIMVALRGPFPSSRTWDHPPVTLELSDELPMVRQGDGPPRHVGLVRTGDEITIVSRQDRFHSVRARGAAFWTFTLPDRDRPLNRRLDRPGLVHLSSGAGYYWMHADLLVGPHPYCAVTDASGRFELAQVPAGEYELVIYLPPWTPVRRERDPETTALVRIEYGPVQEIVRTVRIAAGAAADVAVTIPE